MKKEHNDLNFYKMRIGKNITFLRTHYHKTQEDIYPIIDKSQATLSKYENGTSSIPLDAFLELCQYFGVEPGRMMMEDFSEENFDIPQEKQTVVLEKEPNAKPDRKKRYFEEKDLYLYHYSTSDRKFINESVMTTLDEMPDNSIPLMIDAKQNSENQQIYVGYMKESREHIYFYFENTNRNEEGMIITYLYPQKNTEKPLILVGIMLSTSHGSRQRPCAQRCLLVSEQIDLEIAERILKIENMDVEAVNGDSILYLQSELDKYAYKLVRAWLSRE